jgi:hypothetical protein
MSDVSQHIGKAPAYGNNRKKLFGNPLGAPTVPYLRNGFLRVPMAGRVASFRERRCNSTQPNTDIIALPFTVVRVVEAF